MPDSYTSALSCVTLNSETMCMLTHTHARTFQYGRKTSMECKNVEVAASSDPSMASAADRTGSGLHAGTEQSG